MFYYQNNTIAQALTATNFEEVGNVKLIDMHTVPFYAPYYKGKEIPLKSFEMCHEFDGDCFKFAKKYLRYEWL